VERILEALGGELSATALYGILRLRAEVFVVEQDCVYLDLDGRDLEPSTRHLWIEEEGRGAVLAALRVLAEPGGGTSIGRVVTAPAFRSRGLAAELMKTALATAARPIHLKAQSHLVDWYARFGFAPSGGEFVEDGIPHTPMVLPA